LAGDAITTEHLCRFFRVREESGSGISGFFKDLVTPKRKTVTALDDVRLTIRTSELFGLLGPNGAGKTTFIKILCTLLLPSKGVAKIGGRDVIEEAAEVRRLVGVVLGGERALYWRLSGWENLWFFSQLYGIPGDFARQRIKYLLDLVGLADRAHERVEGYSKGMKQRLHLARGLINDPEVLLLDEPTLGLDPAAARTIRELIREICRRDGKTIVLTTHYLYEADELSDRVAIIDHGKIIALGTPDELKSRTRQRQVLSIIVRNPPPRLVERLAAKLSLCKVVGNLSPDGSLRVKILADDLEGATSEATTYIVEGGGTIASVKTESPSLEDVYIELTGRQIEEAAIPVGQA